MPIDEIFGLREVEAEYEQSYHSASQVPAFILDKIYKKVRMDDLVTPLNMGKEWTFEFTSRYQPRTAALLLNGGEFRYFTRDTGIPSIINNAMAFEANDRVIQIFRYYWNDSPDDPGYQANIERANANLLKRFGYPRKRVQRQFSLPEPIRMAYYQRFDGLSIPDSPVFGAGGRLLPLPSGGAWESIDRHLGYFRLKKKLLPVIEEMIPNIKPERKEDLYTNFMMFLNSWGSFTGKKRSDGDHLYVKNHMQDGVVYYIRDTDVAGMTILADPAEAIDRYCEHILLRKEGRFDFRPWAIPFVSPTV
jgi:hypothetical protein